MICFFFLFCVLIKVLLKHERMSWWIVLWCPWWVRINTWHRCCYDYCCIM